MAVVSSSQLIRRHVKSNFSHHNADKLDFGSKLTNLHDTIKAEEKKWICLKKCTQNGTTNASKLDH
jgi:hypothetical protein